MPATFGRLRFRFVGSPDHVVEAAIALLSYDMDEERGFNKQVSGSPVEPAKSNGFLSEPVLLAPLSAERWMTACKFSLQTPTVQKARG